MCSDLCELCQVIKELYPDPPSAIYVDSTSYENGHAPLADAFARSKPIWNTMNAKATLPTAGTHFPVAFIADQDEASRDFVFRALSSGTTTKQWKSMFWYRASELYASTGARA